jgi:hypothetical protein
VRPFVAWAAELRLVARFAVWLDRLPPYPTLILFLVPFIVLEPFKIGALILLARGNFALGVPMLAIAHILSIVLVERLFHATRDKLLTIAWFAWIYRRVMALYDWSLGRLKARTAWQVVAETLRRGRRALRMTILGLRRTTAPLLRPLFTAVRAAVARLRARLQA